MQNSILLQNVSPEQFTELITNVFKSQLADFKKNFNTHNPDELLTRAEACEFLKIEQTTLYHWTRKGKIICHGIANRRYYKKAELLECLIQLKK
ncbi:helix-turn-helix domain-containing protein [Flavobacterium sp.]|uniref:helix-turn-helix domain-containing protein n=1 Tax=Flavobacterium sp. TaxID=239 RepID=UPI002B4AAEE0|nr:helix-turn-helix domain-containing protein [Flavobacterium sp.]HLF51060.1 helix-turn-helix domain-containing protein [Flavobacterium sp.]